ncbi:hypothetical protein L2E82_40260 [Cichorium intybus]|uniref:Uncharacterized protein n=1 Tax=Cichorium intybus TaxID=13427 RepID=A0ACB9AJZ3_CICIN|nr:hypothetical protein L2E82_40260 [Cichorium intybus]
MKKVWIFCKIMENEVPLESNVCDKKMGNESVKTMDVDVYKPGMEKWIDTREVVEMEDYSDEMVAQRNEGCLEVGSVSDSMPPGFDGVRFHSPIMSKNSSKVHENFDSNSEKSSVNFIIKLRACLIELCTENPNSISDGICGFVTNLTLTRH